jgi:hypothetical protein
MTYACPIWEYVADPRLLKLQCLQNRVLRAIENFEGCTPIRELHVAFKIHYVYDYITTLCRTQAEIILNHVNLNIRGTGRGKAKHRKNKRLQLGGGHVYDHSSD